ncbi:MAG: hypothetical protein KAU07_01335 [Candidatus Andersenbacteria bacterium]|nr:hypothetical protein [Candidatus Andersenbacteria bacterium]
MANEIISSIFFGFGIISQVIFLIGYRFNEEVIKKIKKDISWGLFFMFFIPFITLKLFDPLNIDSLILVSIYAFYFGFSISFALSFKKKILLYINEINLYALNIIFLYYCIAYLGILGPVLFALNLSVLILILFIHYLKKSEFNIKGCLYLSYISLFIFISIINVSFIWSEAMYISSFLIGGIFLYIFVYITYLLIFIPITDERNSYAIRSKNLEIKNHYNQLDTLFYKTKINNFKILALFITLISFLIINFYSHYISDSFLIVSILLIASVSSARKIDLTKKDVAGNIKNH